MTTAHSDTDTAGAPAGGASRWLVSTEWLASRLGAPDVVVLDGSYYLATMQRDATAEYRAGHIPGALRFDIDKVADHTIALPHMLPSPDQFARDAGRAWHHRNRHDRGL